jgi:RecB family exonuclease
MTITETQISRFMEQVEEALDQFINPRLSPSSIATFLQCPKKFFYDRSFDQPVVPTVAQTTGSFTHLVLEALMGEPPQARTLIRAKELATLQFNEYTQTQDWQLLVDFNCEYPDSDTLKLAFKNLTWKYIKTFFAMYTPHDINVMATEQQLSGTIADIPVLGIIDRLDTTETGYQIVDYKTGKKPATSYQQDVKRQVSIYSMLTEQTLSTQSNQATLVYLKTGEELNLNITPKLLNSATQDVVTAHTNIGKCIEKRNFPTKLNTLCNWCPHITYCPAHNPDIPA